LCVDCASTNVKTVQQQRFYVDAASRVIPSGAHFDDEWVWATVASQPTRCVTVLVVWWYNIRGEIILGVSEIVSNQASEQPRDASNKDNAASSRINSCNLEKDLGVGSRI